MIALCEGSFSIKANEPIWVSKDSDTINGGIFSKHTEPQQWCSTLGCTLEYGNESLVSNEESVFCDKVDRF